MALLLPVFNYSTENLGIYLGTSIIWLWINSHAQLLVLSTWFNEPAGRGEWEGSMEIEEFLPVSSLIDSLPSFI